MSNHGDDWKTWEQRQHVVSKMKDFLQSNGISDTKISIEMENRVFQVAKSKEEYFSSLGRMLLDKARTRYIPASKVILNSADNLGDNMNERINTRHNEEGLQEQRNHQENLNERIVNVITINQEPKSEETTEGPCRDASANDMNKHMKTRYNKLISQGQRNVKENLDEQSAGGPSDEINVGPPVVVNGTIVKEEIDIEEDTESRKRRYSENETSMEHGVKISRVDLPDQASGSRTASEIRRVAIITEIQETEVSEKDAFRLQERIMGIVDDIPEGDFVPRFYETFYEQGALRISCVDEETELWLREKVPNLPYWPGPKLKVVKTNELPNYVTVVANIPAPAPSNAKLILKRLEKQNPGFSTKKWKIRQRIGEDQNREIRLVLDVDEQTISSLENLGMKPFYGMGQATFNLLVIQTREEED